MRFEKELSEWMVAEALANGLNDVRVERGRKHPRLVGWFQGTRVVIGLPGTTKDKNGFEIARQYLRRALWRLSGKL